jgi:hypothetical protein
VGFSLQCAALFEIRDMFSLVHRIKKLIETKIMVSFIEMNGFYYAVLWISDIWFGFGSADLYR